MAALVRQTFLKALYQAILSSLKYRVLFAIVVQQVINVPMGVILDQLVQWRLAQEGKFTTQGSMYTSQAAGFGAVQGLVAVPMQFAAGWLAGHVSKWINKGVRGSLFDDLVNAFRGRPGSGPDVPPSGGGKPGARPPADQVFARGFSDRVDQVLKGLSRPGGLDGAGEDTFVTSMGNLFARRFGEDMGVGAARGLGREWADTLVRGAGREGLGGALDDVLARGLPVGVGDDVRRAMSYGVARHVGPDSWAGKFGAFLVQGVGEGATGVGAEMAYNAMAFRTFSVGAAGFYSGFASERLNAVLEINAGSMGAGLRARFDDLTSKISAFTDFSGFRNGLLNGSDVPSAMAPTPVASGTNSPNGSFSATTNGPIVRSGNDVSVAGEPASTDPVSVRTTTSDALFQTLSVDVDPITVTAPTPLPAVTGMDIPATTLPGIDIPTTTIPTTAISGIDVPSTVVPPTTTSTTDTPPTAIPPTPTSSTPSDTSSPQDRDAATLPPPVSRSAPHIVVPDSRGLRDAVTRAAVAALREDGATRTGEPDPARQDPNPLTRINCVILLEHLTRHLYPANNLHLLASPNTPTAPGGTGVRAAVTVDDINAGTSRTDRRLADGPGWRTVTSWDTVQQALDGAEPGSSALILSGSATGDGHAFAAFRTTTEVNWVEMQADTGPFTGPDQPRNLPLNTRAVIVGPDGTVRPDALPEQPSTATLDALTDPPASLDYAGLAEEQRATVRRPTGYPDLMGNLFQDDTVRVPAPLPPAPPLPAPDWHALAHAPVFDVPRLLAEFAATPGATVDTTVRGLADAIVRQTGGPLDAAVLTFDIAATETPDRVRGHLAWALGVVREDLRQEAGSDPQAEARARRFVRVHHTSYLNPRLLLDRPGTLYDSLAAVDHQVRAVRAAFARGADPLPVPPPPEPLRVLGIRPQNLLVALTEELGVPVRLDVRNPDGSTYRRWAESSGLVYAQDPTPGGVLPVEVHGVWGWTVLDRTLSDVHTRLPDLHRYARLLTAPRLPRAAETQAALPPQVVNDAHTALELIDGLTRGTLRQHVRTAVDRIDALLDPTAITSLTTELAGRQPTGSRAAQVGALTGRLVAAGDGASAMLLPAPDGPPASPLHLVNVDGVIRWVDADSGPLPDPRVPGSAFRALEFDPDGHPLAPQPDLLPLGGHVWPLRDLLLGDAEWTRVLDLAAPERPSARVAPPVPFSDQVTAFGTGHTGALDLVHILPVPQTTVDWLQDQVIRAVESTANAANAVNTPNRTNRTNRPNTATAQALTRPDETFRSAVRSTLTTRFLSADWPRLFSASGLPLRVPYRGTWYPVSLRLATADPERADPGMEQLADGPPAAVHRWAYANGEITETVGEGGLRPGTAAYTRSFPIGRRPLAEAAISPQAAVAHNQAGSWVTTGRTVFPMVRLRSSERTFPFTFAMEWELRTGDAAGELLAGRLPDDRWEATEGPAPDRLTVWFPRHLVEPVAAPAPDPADPATRPAPLSRLLDEVPLYSLVSIPGHDRLAAHIVESFPGHLDQLSDSSREALREFLSEGSLRVNMPFLWGGSLPSPTLYDTRGTVLGYLRLDVDLTGGDKVTGPMFGSAQIQSILNRTVRMTGGSSVTNSLGVNLPVPGVSLTLGGGTDPDTGAPRVGGSLSVQVGVRHTFTHTLGSGGSTRVMRTLSITRPLFHITPDVTVRAVLVRPAGPEVRPAEGTPLADPARRYPVNLRVPSADSLGAAPAVPRHLPGHLLHLTSLGTATTTLQVEGTAALFDQARAVLGDRGFLPPPSWSDALGIPDAATQKSVRAGRLDNLRRFDQARERLGLRSALDEMIDGGLTTTFTLPTTAGVRRATLTLVAERAYQDAGPHAGVVHESSVPAVYTANFFGAGLSGEESFTTVPLAWSAGVSGTVTNPVGFLGGTRPLTQAGAEYVYSAQNAHTRGSATGADHDYYVVNPSAEGIQVFRVPVTYRMELSFSEGPSPSPWQGDGWVRLAVPTFRTLTDPLDTPGRTLPLVRDKDQADEPLLRQPENGDRTLQNGVLRLPETAFLTRVEGSGTLRGAVHDLLAGLDREAAVLAETAERAATIPGAWPEDPGARRERSLEDPGAGRERSLEDPGPAPRHAEPASVPAPDSGAADDQRLAALDNPGGIPLNTLATNPADPTDPVPAPQPPAPSRLSGLSGLSGLPGLPGLSRATALAGTAASTAAGVVGRAALTAARWVAVPAAVDGAWKFVRHMAVGDPVTAPESGIEQAVGSALSPQHLQGHAIRVFRDSYVIEAGSTPGALAGTDVTVEVRGYLKDVHRLPQAPKLTIERYNQTNDASSTTEAHTSGHRLAGTLTARYGTGTRSFDPAGTYSFTTATTRSTTVADRTGSARGMVDEGMTAHLFTATPVYVVTVRQSLNNLVTGTVHPGSYLERSRVVEVPAGIEFGLVDDDLRNHGEFTSLGGPTPAPATPRDRMLPPWYRDTGGVMATGTVTEAHLDGGRGALNDAVLASVEEQAPGSTVPGSATYRRNVLTRINEHTSALGVRSLPEAGPAGHTAFHFVHTSWLGPRLVEVSFSARPVPDPVHALDGIRGGVTDPFSGFDSLYDRSSGEGTSLRVPGATQLATTRTVGHGLDFAPVGQVRGNQGRPRLGLSATRATTENQSSSRHTRDWARTLNTVDFHAVPYEYGWRVTSRPLTEALLVRIVSAGLGGLTGGLLWAGRASRVLDLLPPALRHLPDPAGESHGTLRGRLNLRFPADEAPPAAAAPLPGALVAPAVLALDPTAPVPPPAPGAVVLQIQPHEVPTEVRALLTGAPWQPTRPIQLYGFDGLPQLAQALREVDPALRDATDPQTSRSPAGMLLRLTDLVRSYRPTALEPARVATFLGREGSPGITLRIGVYAARPETTSKDVALDRMVMMTDGFGGQTSKTSTFGAVFGGSPLDTDGIQRGGPSIPLLGGTSTVGQGSSSTGQRRDVLRTGTTQPEADGSGLTGHRVRAVAVVEVRGPAGTRWVVGDLLLRTTETPPPLPTNGTGRIGGTGRTDGTGGTGGNPVTSAPSDSSDPLVDHDPTVSPPDHGFTTTPAEYTPTASPPDHGFTTTPTATPPHPYAPVPDLSRRLAILDPRLPALHRQALLLSAPAPGEPDALRNGLPRGAADGARSALDAMTRLARGMSPDTPPVVADRVTGLLDTSAAGRLTARAALLSTHGPEPAGRDALTARLRAAGDGARALLVTDSTRPGTSRTGPWYVHNTDGQLHWSDGDGDLPTAPSPGTLGRYRSLEVDRTGTLLAPPWMLRTLGAGPWSIPVLADGAPLETFLDLALGTGTTPDPDPDPDPDPTPDPAPGSPAASVSDHITAVLMGDDAPRPTRPTEPTAPARR
ncbi:hypothetical protein AB0D49_22705 [Streptomyces sp. NPDC048290]|uniref:hypothetical protein n=1 Tax=Streptomyces sp. NPDC048290 TaxID=3155811 RepID=UPI003444E15F